MHAVTVSLEVDPPQLVGDELAVVRVERGVGVEMDDGRITPVGGCEHERVDTDLPFLEVPVRPHRAVLDDLARRRPDVDLHRLSQHRPEPLRPRAWSKDELLADSDATFGRLDGGDGVVRVELEPLDLDARENGDVFPFPAC